MTGSILADITQENDNKHNTGRKGEQRVKVLYHLIIYISSSWTHVPLLKEENL